MIRSFKTLILLCLFNSILEAGSLTVMTLNVDNLFDTFDDQKKDDKAFLHMSHGIYLGTQSLDCDGFDDCLDVAMNLQGFQQNSTRAHLETSKL